MDKLSKEKTNADSTLWRLINASSLDMLLRLTWVLTVYGHLLPKYEVKNLEEIIVKATGMSAKDVKSAADNAEEENLETIAEYATRKATEPDFS